MNAQSVFWIIACIIFLAILCVFVVGYRNSRPYEQKLSKFFQTPLPEFPIPTQDIQFRFIVSSGSASSGFGGVLEFFMKGWELEHPGTRNAGYGPRGSTGFIYGRVQVNTLSTTSSNAIQKISDITNKFYKSSGVPKPGGIGLTQFKEWETELDMRELKFGDSLPERYTTPQPDKSIGYLSGLPKITDRVNNSWASLNITYMNDRVLNPNGHFRGPGFISGKDVTEGYVDHILLEARQFNSSGNQFKMNRPAISSNSDLLGILSRGCPA